MNLRKAITLVYAAAFLLVSLVAGVFFVRTEHEYAALRQQEAASRRRLAELEEKLLQQQHYLERLNTDPDFVERVIRQKLGYARPNEYIFRFDE